MVNIPPLLSENHPQEGCPRDGVPPRWGASPCFPVPKEELRTGKGTAPKNEQRGGREEGPALFLSLVAYSQCSSPLFTIILLKHILKIFIAIYIFYVRYQSCFCGEASLPPTQVSSPPASPPHPPPPPAPLHTGSGGGSTGGAVGWMCESPKTHKWESRSPR